MSLQIVQRNRIAAALIFAVLVLGAEARALPSQPFVKTVGVTGAAESFWNWLTSPFLPGSYPPAQLSLTLPAGCGLDPNGYDPACPGAVSPEHRRPIEGRVPSPRQR